MAAITKKTTIGEVLNRNLDTAKFFMEIGMHCLGCPASQGESIEEACMVHGTNADELVAKLNAFSGRVRGKPEPANAGSVFLGGTWKVWF